MIEAAKKMYYEEKLIMRKENSKMIWNTLNQILNKSNKSSKIAKMQEITHRISLATRRILQHGQKFKTLALDMT